MEYKKGKIPSIYVSTKEKMLQKQSRRFAKRKVSTEDIFKESELAVQQRFPPTYRNRMILSTMKFPVCLKWFRSWEISQWIAITSHFCTAMLFFPI